jgi:hypothetical protein
MTPFDQWAVRHNIPFGALMELHAMFYPPELQSEPDPDGRMESYSQSLIRRAAPRAGWSLFRNNVGALKSEAGTWVRFGLCNDSPQMNAVVKSADLIGLRPVLILPEHVGTTIGQFVSIEAKHPGWKPGEDTKREKAQTAWAGLIRSKGGLAVFSTGALPE